MVMVFPKSKKSAPVCRILYEGASMSEQLFKLEDPLHLYLGLFFPHMEENSFATCACGSKVDVLMESSWQM